MCKNYKLLKSTQCNCALDNDCQPITYKKMRLNSFIKKVTFLLSVFLFLSCKNHPIDCKTTKINIENRWSDKNGGIDYLDVKDPKDIVFICNRISNFSNGKDVRISYSYGDIDIVLDKRKVQAIFTYRYGVVYRVGVGKYVYDEALTKKIMELMKINKRCWGEDCK